MALRTNIVRRDATYYHRVRVPSDLVKVIGRREMKRSLGTNDPLVVLADRDTDVVHTMRNATDWRISNPLKYQLFWKLASPTGFEPVSPP
jgi:hypothetical protein